MVKIRLAEQEGFEIISHFLTAIKDKWSLSSMYRGHADKEWLPIASVFRPNSLGITEQQHLTKWKSVAQRFVSPKPADDIEYLVLAQHYGIPTALLDWSSNPLTALFFATEGREDNKTVGQVIGVNKPIFEFAEYTGSIMPFAERAKPFLLDTSAMNLRSTAQDSFMTLHTKSEPPFNTWPIFDIPHSSKWKVRKSLAILGLTPERVYADLGIAAARFREDRMFDEVFS